MHANALRCVCSGDIVLLRLMLCVRILRGSDPEYAHMLLDKAMRRYTYYLLAMLWLLTRALCCLAIISQLRVCLDRLHDKDIAAHIAVARPCAASVP